MKNLFFESTDRWDNKKDHDIYNTYYIFDDNEITDEKLTAKEKFLEEYFGVKFDQTIDP